MIVGCLLLGGLLTLRFFAPGYVVGQSVSAVLAVGWPLAFGAAIIWEKNAPLGRKSPWHGLLVITSLFVGAATDFALGIGVLYSPKSEFPLPLLVFLVLVAIVCVVGWWRLLWGSREIVRNQGQMQTALAIVLLLGIALWLAVSRAK